MAIFIKLFVALSLFGAFSTFSHAQDNPAITFYKTQIIVHPDNIQQTAPLDDFMASKPKAGHTEIVYLAKSPTQLSPLDSQSFEATLSTTSFHPDVKKNNDFERVPLHIVQEIEISRNEKVYLDYNGMVYLVFINNGDTKEDKVQMATALTFEKEAFDYIFLSNDLQLFGVKPNLEVMQFDRSFLLKGYDKFKYYFPNLSKFHIPVVAASTLLGLAGYITTKDSEYLSQAAVALSIGPATFFYITTNLSIFLRDFSNVSEISNSIKRPYMFFKKTGLTLTSAIRSIKISNREAKKSIFNNISYDIDLKNDDALDLASLLQPYGEQNNTFKSVYRSQPALAFKAKISSCLDSLK